MAAETKYHKLGGLKIQEFIFSVPKTRNQRSLSVDLLFSKTYLLGLQMAAFSLRPHMTSPLCVHIPGIQFFLYKDTTHTGLAPTLTDSL